MYGLVRKLLFSLPPETAHTLTLKGLSLLCKAGLCKTAFPPEAPVNIMGLQLPNPVGLAAGLDKNGDYIDGLGSLGFGFIELGTVTPRPQEGNPKPRLFRLVSEQAIINRMGFNNKGVDYLVKQVRNSRYKGVLGINIGKNRDTSIEKAVDDYLYCMRKVYPVASYITINLSSPNTPGLRDLQFGKALDQLLEAIKAEQARLAKINDVYKPVVIKIAPDMAEEDITQAARSFIKYGIDGVIATNTTIDRKGVSNNPRASEKGGLSGAPLTLKSTRTIQVLDRMLKGKIPIIGVGGIMIPNHAIDKIDAGASAVQVYSGLIYQGPRLVKSICNKVRKK